MLQSRLRKDPFRSRDRILLSFNDTTSQCVLNIAFELGLIPWQSCCYQLLLMKGFRPGQIVDVQWSVFILYHFLSLSSVFVSNIFNDLFYTKSLWIMLILSIERKQAFLIEYG